MKVLTPGLVLFKGHHVSLWKPLAAAQALETTHTHTHRQQSHSLCPCASIIIIARTALKVAINVRPHFVRITWAGFFQPLWRTEQGITRGPRVPKDNSGREVSTKCSLALAPSGLFTLNSKFERQPTTILTCNYSIKLKWLIKILKRVYLDCQQLQCHTLPPLIWW